MKTLVLVAFVCVLQWPVSVLAQQPLVSSSPPDAGTAILTLDEAVSLALSHNRLVQDAVLDAQKHDFRVNVARSRRLPQFQFAVLAGHLVRPIDSSFPAGSFGTYPETGPIPSTDAKIRTPARLTTLFTGSVDLPLTQQYKIGLAIRATELAGDVARESIRKERQKIAAEVRSGYLTLVATQTAVDAAREAVRTLEEAERVTAQHAAQETVLRADALEVEARLAKSRYELSVAEHGLASRREHLNQLLGRDIRTGFRVAGMPEGEAAGVTLETARERAADNRPEIRQALLKTEQAEYDRRLARAEYIPDVSLSLRHFGFHNFEVVPGNVATAGLLLTWEPFDWGRRRNAVAEKAKTVEQARNGAQETASRIAVEVGATYRKCHDASLQVKAARAGYMAALEQFRVMSNRYKAEAALLRELLEKQARSSEAAFQYQQALSTYWGALADLHRTMGDE